jgi:predicted DNA-binding transcriptional regulator YafY
MDFRKGGGALKLEQLHMSKLAHLTQILITLQYERLVTASELAEVINVDKKTIYRYIDTLVTANIPVHTKKGRHGGFYLDDEIFIKDVKLDEEEIKALLIAAHILTTDNGFAFEHELKRAVTKIKNVSIKNDDVLSVINPSKEFKIYNIGDLEKIDDMMCKINYAMSKGRSLDISYYSQTKNSAAKGRMDPYNIVLREGDWHIIAYSHLKNEVMLLNLSRVKSLRVTEDIFIKPKDFSLGDFLEKNWGLFRGSNKQIKIKFSKKAAEFVKDIKWHPYQSIESQEDGGIILSLYLDEFAEIKQWILGFGAEAEVLEPEELRKEISDDITELYINYKIENVVKK